MLNFGDVFKSDKINVIKKIDTYFSSKVGSPLLEMDPNSFCINAPRFRLPINVRTGLTSNEVIHSFCNVLLESWIRPTTREYSYQILSLDNFNRMFYKIWNVIVKHNHPPRKVYTFTLAFENEVLIVLKYSAGYRVERFVLFTQALIDFLADLYKKHEQSAISKECSDGSSLLVKIKRTLLGPNAIKNVENNLNNVYGITYGPSAQQLVQCYLLPEIEKPCTLLGHALAINAKKERFGSDSGNLLFSRFVRTKDKDENCEDEFTEVEDDIAINKEAAKENIEQEKRIQPFKIVSLKNVSKVQYVVTRPINEKRAASPIEADIPSCIQKEQSLSKWGQSCYQESANLGPKTNTVAANNTNVEAIRSKDQCDPRDSNKAAEKTKSNKIQRKNLFVASETESENNIVKHKYNSAKLVQHSTPYAPNVANEENEESNALNICCGLDSRYCNCYSLEGYVPKTLCYEIVMIRIVPIDIEVWRIIMAKYTYDPSFTDIYKTGDLNPVEHLKTSKLKSICLSEAWKKHGDKILNEKFVMTVPCNLYRIWGNQKKISIDTKDMSLTMVPVKSNTLLSTLNVLSVVYTDFSEKEFSNVLEHICVYFEDMDGLGLKSNKRAIQLVDSPHKKCDISPKSMLNQSGILTDVQRHEESQQNKNGDNKTANLPKQMVSIGIQAVLPNVPFSIVCLADIRSNVETNPPITGEFLFKHGFQTSLNADYQTRIQHIKTGWKLDTSQYVIKVLKDLSVCMLCKDELNENITLPQGLDMNYIHQVDKLFTDTLEWDKEAVKGVALPFYFKKLKPAFISTENDFPSTLVAKKKITNLIIDAYSVLKLNGSKAIPVLWISSKNLELSMIRHRVTSDHIFPLFQKSSNSKYSIDTIYLPESITSKIIHNTKYGTFDTLPMELQQTSRVFIKLSDYPRPFLLIISDAYVFNTKLSQQCQALMQYEKNIQEPEDIPNSNIQIDCAVRSRQSARKPPNFYNETSSRRDFEINLHGATSEKPCQSLEEHDTQLSKQLTTVNQLKENECLSGNSVPEINITIDLSASKCLNTNKSDNSPMQVVETNEITCTNNRLETGAPSNLQEQLMETTNEETLHSELLESQNSQNMEEQLMEVNGVSSASVNSDLIRRSETQKNPINDPKSVSSDATNTVETQTNPLNYPAIEENKEPLNSQPRTRVSCSLPLQKKYALIQERNREIRRRTDKMFLKSDRPRLREKFEAKLFNSRVMISRVNGKSTIKRKKKKTFENKDSNITESTGLVNCIDRLNNIDKNFIVKHWLENEVVYQNNNLPITNRNTKGNKLDGKKTVISPAFRELLQYKKPSQEKIYSEEIDLEENSSRNQVSYDDMMTPVRIDEDNFEFDLAKAKANLYKTFQPLVNNEFCLEGQSLVEERQQQQEQLALAMDDNNYGLTQCAGGDMEIGTELEVETFRSTFEEKECDREKLPDQLNPAEGDNECGPIECAGGSLVVGTELDVAINSGSFDGELGEIEEDIVFYIETLSPDMPFTQDESQLLVETIDEPLAQSTPHPGIESAREAASECTDESLYQSNSCGLIIDDTCQTEADTTLEIVEDTLEPAVETSSQLSVGMIPQLVAKNSTESEVASSRISPTRDQGSPKMAEPVQQDRNVLSPKEQYLQSMSLRELLLTYPKISISNIRGDTSTDANRRKVYKKVLKEKIREKFSQSESLRRCNQHLLNSKTNTVSDANISVDIQVTLNALNGGLSNIGSPTVYDETIPSDPFIFEKRTMVESIACEDKTVSETSKKNNSDRTASSASPGASERNVPIRQPRIRVSSLGNFNNMLVPMKEQSYVVDKDSAMAIDLSLHGTNTLNPNKNIHQITKVNKRKTQTPCKIQNSAKVRQIQSKSTKQTSPMCGNENGRALTINELLLQVPRFEKTGQLSSMVCGDSCQYIGGIEPMVVFSPRPPHSTTPDIPYVDRGDDSGVAVSESSRCSSTYQQTMSRNMQHVSLVPTVPNVFHVRGSNHMMYPESTLPRHIDEASHAMSANHSRINYQSKNYLPPSHSPTNCPPPLQSMGLMNRFPSDSESSLMSRYNDVYQTNNICHPNYPPPSYMPTFNENNNEPMPMMPRDAPTCSDLSHSHIALTRQSRLVENRPMHHPLSYYSRDTCIPSLLWKSPRAEPRYYHSQIFGSSVSTNSMVQMQPTATSDTARPYINIEHNQHITSRVVNSNSEFNSHYSSMIPPAYYYRPNNFNER